MPRIKYLEHDGTVHEIDVRVGSSVMEGAIRNGVPGIEAECGGVCSCATCHVFIDADWTDVVGPPNEMEAAMLDFAPGVQPNSRLSCQIEVTDAIEGLIVRMPKSQR